MFILYKIDYLFVDYLCFVEDMDHLYIKIRKKNVLNDRVGRDHSDLRNQREVKSFKKYHLSRYIKTP